MDYESLFSCLNEKLADENLTLDVHCVGGFVLEYHGFKATDDIDAFYESSKTIERIIDEVGEKFHVGKPGEPWLNNHVSHIMTYIKKEDEEVIYSASNLKVSVASIETVFNDKIIAARAKDRDDISRLMLALNKKDLKSILKVLEYSEGTTDLSIIFDAYIRAFGETALDNYLQEHPEMEKYL